MFLPNLPISFRNSLLVYAALTAAISTHSIAHAQSTPAAGGAPDRAHIEEVLKGMNRGRGINQVAISPDGKHLAWIEGGRGGGAIQVAPMNDLKKTQKVTASTKPDQHCHESEMAWEPDSQALAFFSDCAHEGEQTDL